MVKIKPRKVRWDKLAIATHDGKIGIFFGCDFFYRENDDVIKVSDCSPITLCEWVPPPKFTTKPWAEMKRMLHFEEGAYGNRLKGHLSDCDYFYTEWHMQQFFLEAEKEWDENETCSSTIYHISPGNGAVYGSVCRGIGFDPRLLDGFIPTREELLEILGRYNHAIL